MLLKLISPLRPGLIEAGRRERLPVPDHADQAERLDARAPVQRPCGVTLRDFRCYEQRRGGRSATA